MTVVIGTDEAGYGPNLGPLVITATAWRFPDGWTPEQCWVGLSDCVSRTRPDSPAMLHIADSKQVYSSGQSMAPLEQSVLTLLAVLGHQPVSIRQIGEIIAGSSFAAAWTCEPCHVSRCVRVPVVAEKEDIAESTTRLRNTLSKNSAALLCVNSRILYPSEFNALVQQFGSKGRVLSSATLELVADVTESQQLRSAEVICDKHGGRNRYDGIISNAFNDQFVFRMEESRQLSRYRLNSFEFRFQPRAEEFLPVATASMVSKYVREIAMLEFNQFWKNWRPGLKRTMGYPVDAARFLEDIRDLLGPLKIDLDAVWRSR